MVKSKPVTGQKTANVVIASRAQIKTGFTSRRVVGFAVIETLRFVLLLCQSLMGQRCAGDSTRTASFSREVGVAIAQICEVGGT